MSALWRRRLLLVVVNSLIGLVLLLGLVRLQQLEKIAAWTVYTDLLTLSVNLKHVASQLNQLAGDPDFSDAAAEDIISRLLITDDSAQRLVFFAKVFGHDRWLIRHEVLDLNDSRFQPLVSYVTYLHAVGTLSDADRSFLREVCEQLTSVRQSVLTLRIVDGSLDNLLPRDWTHLTDALSHFSACMQSRPDHRSNGN